MMLSYMVLIITWCSCSCLLINRRQEELVMVLSSFGVNLLKYWLDFSKAVAECSLWTWAVSSTMDGSSYDCSVMREVLSAAFTFQVLGCWNRGTRTILGGTNED